MNKEPLTLDESSLVISDQQAYSFDRGRKKGVLWEIRKNSMLYLMAVPGLLFFLIFSYLPMFGIIIAFKDYQISKGIWGSDWNGFGNFEFFFTSGDALRVTFNTLFLNTLFISSTIICGVVFAILLNEISHHFFKRLSQSLMFLPYFVSWIIVSLIARGLFESNTGTMNNLFQAMNLEPLNWFSTPILWPFLLTLFRVWHNAGFYIIIFLAAIAGIDPTYYEAAIVDGASKWQRIRHITLPMLMPTILILALLAIGRIFYGDFAMIYGIIGDNGLLYSTTDVIDTYVFRALRQMNDFGMSAAAGLYQSVFGFIVILTSNHLVKKYNNEGSLF